MKVNQFIVLLGMLASTFGPAIAFLEAFERRGPMLWLIIGQFLLSAAAAFIYIFVKTFNPDSEGNGTPQGKATAAEGDDDEGEDRCKKKPKKEKLDQRGKEKGHKSDKKQKKSDKKKSKRRRSAA